MSNNVVEILKGVVGELREIAKSETVIGEPVTVGDRTVIPVVKISVGFGAGGGQGEDEKARSSAFGEGHHNLLCRGPRFQRQNARRESYRILSKKSEFHQCHCQNARLYACN